MASKVKTPTHNRFLNAPKNCDQRLVASKVKTRYLNRGEWWRSIESDQRLVASKVKTPIDWLEVRDRYQRDQRLVASKVKTLEVA